MHKNEKKFVIENLLATQQDTYFTAVRAVAALIAKTQLVKAIEADREDAEEGSVLRCEISSALIGQHLDQNFVMSVVDVLPEVFAHQVIEASGGEILEAASGNLFELLDEHHYGVSVDDNGNWFYFHTDEGPDAADKSTTFHTPEEAAFACITDKKLSPDMSDASVSIPEEMKHPIGKLNLSLTQIGVVKAAMTLIKTRLHADSKLGSMSQTKELASLALEDVNDLLTQVESLEALVFSPSNNTTH